MESPLVIACCSSQRATSELRLFQVNRAEYLNVVFRISADKQEPREESGRLIRNSVATLRSHRQIENNERYQGYRRSFRKASSNEKPVIYRKSYLLTDEDLSKNAKELENLNPASSSPVPFPSLRTSSLFQGDNKPLSVYVKTNGRLLLEPSKSFQKKTVKSGRKGCITGFLSMLRCLFRQKRKEKL